jgi:hypothetical protein
MILRRIGAVVLGVITAVILVQVAEFGVHSIYPPPPGTNVHDMNAVKTFVAKLPTPAFVLVLFGWLVATLAGTFIAAKIGRTAVTAYIVGALLLCGGIVNAFVIPQPLWFTIASFVIYIGGTIVGARLST